jgi:hypothetical protein
MFFTAALLYVASQTVLVLALVIRLITGVAMIIYRLSSTPFLSRQKWPTSYRSPDAKSAEMVAVVGRM